jgi:hypothetical protein
MVFYWYSSDLWQVNGFLLVLQWLATGQWFSTGTWPVASHWSTGRKTIDLSQVTGLPVENHWPVASHCSTSRKRQWFSTGTPVTCDRSMVFYWYSSDLRQVNGFLLLLQWLGPVASHWSTSRKTIDLSQVTGLPVENHWPVASHWSTSRVTCDRSMVFYCQ